MDWQKFKCQFNNRRKVGSSPTLQIVLEGKKVDSDGRHNPNVVITTIKEYLQSHIKGFIQYVEIYSFPF